MLLSRHQLLLDLLLQKLLFFDQDLLGLPQLLDGLLRSGRFGLLSWKRDEEMEPLSEGERYVSIRQNFPVQRARQLPRAGDRFCRWAPAACRLPRGTWLAATETKRWADLNLLQPQEEESSRGHWELQGGPQHPGMQAIQETHCKIKAKNHNSK